MNPWAEYDAWEQRPACLSHPPGCPDAPGGGLPSLGAYKPATGALGGLAVAYDEAAAWYGAGHTPEEVLNLPRD